MPAGADLVPSASSSASRKRSHAEITRSQTSSTSPQPSKRRRTSGPSSVTPSRLAGQPRLVRDGLDLRRPVNTDMNGHNTIDLTLDDDSPSPQPRERTRSRQPVSVSSTESTTRATTSTHRAPPFPPARPHMVPHAVIIDLSDDDDDDDEDEEDDYDDEEDDDDQEDVPPVESPNEPPSPDIEIIGENPVPRRRSRRVIPPHPNPERRLPSPPMYHATPLGSMANFLRASTAALGMQVGQLGNHMNQLFAMTGRPAHHPLLPFASDDFEAMEINLDYQMDGLNPGNGPASDELEIVQDPDYKAPPMAADGFVRTWEDHDVLVCAKCGDELATGDTEVKQQVWAAKKCGHVYCGECAAERAPTRGGNDRTRKKNRQAHRYKVCQVEGCPAMSGSPSQMFQIYL